MRQDHFINSHYVWIRMKTDFWRGGLYAPRRVPQFTDFISQGHSYRSMSIHRVTHAFARLVTFNITY